MSILKEIYQYKIDFVSNQKEIIPLSKIENKLNVNNLNFPFSEKLNHQNSQISIIGEIKKASPSLGKFTKENINLIDSEDVNIDDKINPSNDFSSMKPFEIYNEEQNKNFDKRVVVGKRIIKDSMVLFGKRKLRKKMK